MAGDRAGREGVRARLVLLAGGGECVEVDGETGTARSSGPPGARPGWVPTSPAGAAPPADAPGTVPGASGGRDEALSSALLTYTAAYGHPLEHATVDGEPVSRRWATRRRVALAAVVLLALLCAAVLVRDVSRLPSTTIEVGAVGGGSAGGSTGPDPADAEPPPVQGPVVVGDAAPDHGAAGAVGDGRPPDTAAPSVVVHVVGQVAAPGIVSLPAGSRVVDALGAAGGPTAEADLSAVNLARVVTDGEQVVVPRPGESPPTPAASAGSTPGSAPGSVAAGPVDLNTADAAALDSLPGIGPVLAERIVAWRTEHGRFTSVEELGEVRGIGPTLLAGLRDAVRV